MNRTPTPTPQDLLELSRRRRFQEGCTVQTVKTGTPYRLENVDHARGMATIRRVIEKPKGKAARKAAKRARQAARRRGAWLT